MLDNITKWFITTGYLEMLGVLFATAIVLGAVYLIYEVVRQLANLYIQMKLIELYKQKDRLWEAYQDLYDNYEDLKEHTWDYQITKDNLKLLTKDVEAIEEYLLGSGFPRSEGKAEEDKIQGVVYDFTMLDVGRGDYLYDKALGIICYVYGWEHTREGDSLMLQYETDNYDEVKYVTIGSLEYFNRRFYLTVSKEPNAAGYVKENIHKHLGIYKED